MCVCVMTATECDNLSIDVATTTTTSDGLTTPTSMGATTPFTNLASIKTGKLRNCLRRRGSSRHAGSEGTPRCFLHIHPHSDAEKLMESESAGGLRLVKARAAHVAPTKLCLVNVFIVEVVVVVAVRV